MISFGDMKSPPPPRAAAENRVHERILGITSPRLMPTRNSIRLTMYFPVRPQRFPAALWRHRDNRHPWRFRRREFDMRCGALIFLTNRGFKLLA